MISTRGRYAIRVMIDLAEHDNGGYIPLKEIATRQEISKNAPNQKTKMYFTLPHTVFIQQKHDIIIKCQIFIILDIKNNDTHPTAL